MRALIHMLFHKCIQGQFTFVAPFVDLVQIYNQFVSLSVCKRQQLSAILVFQSPSDLSHLVASAFVFHKVSAHHQFSKGTYFTTSALVLKFLAFFLFFFQGMQPRCPKKQNLWKEKPLLEARRLHEGYAQFQRRSSHRRGLDGWHAREDVIR